MPINTPTVFGGGAILTSKVGQTDLVFGVRSGFISRFVHGGLQVSACWINAAAIRAALRGRVATRKANDTARRVTTRRVLVVTGEASLSAVMPRLDPPVLC